MRSNESLRFKVCLHLRRAGAPKWYHHFGPKKFLLADLVLGLSVRALYRLSYPSTSRFLDEYYNLRMHFTTLQKAAARLPLVLWRAVLQATAPQESMAAAIDASGFSPTNPSYHYLRRINGQVPRCPVKTSIMVDIDTRKILSARVRMKPRHDTRDVAGLVRQARAKPWQIVMDKGYDSEPLHEFLDGQGIWSIAPTRARCQSGLHRRALRDSFPDGEYAYRNIVEAVFKSLKTRFGGYVRSRQARTVRAELYVRFIMHNMMVWLTRHFLRTPEEQKLYIPPRSRPVCTDVIAMATYKIGYDREGCIGAGSCIGACPKNWSMAEDGKATVGKTEITEAELEMNKEAAEACPVNVIHIINNETGERLI
jgi:ferredoxin/transposase